MDSVCKPLPPYPLQEDASEFNYGGCKALISRLKPVQSLSKHTELMALEPDQQKVLEWLFLSSCGHHKLVPITQSQFQLEARGRIGKSVCGLEHLSPHIILRVQTAYENDVQNGGRIIENQSTRLAFHGTPMENVHSILHNGLWNMSNTRLQRHGAAFGEGIYLAEDIRICDIFAAGAPGWKNSQFGDKISCVFACAVQRGCEE